MESTITRGIEGLWLVDVGARPGTAVALRDYFLRLGVSARLAAPAVVELTTHEDESTLQEFTRNWSRANGVPLALRQAERIQTGARRNGAPSGAFRPRLGEVLQRKGLITEAQLEAGLRESRERGELLGAALLRAGVIFEEELARTLSDQLAVPYVSVRRVGVDAAAARMLPRDVGLQLAAIPVRFKESSVQVAFADPSDPAALDGVRAYVPRIEIAVAELSDIREAWRHVAPPR